MILQYIFVQVIFIHVNIIYVLCTVKSKIIILKTHASV